MFSLGDILRCLTLIQECSDNMAKTRQRRTVAEMCFVKLCTGAQTAAQSAAQSSAVIATAPQPAPSTEFKPMGSEFAPRSDEKLSPSQAAAVKKLQKIFEPVVQEQPVPAAKSAEVPAEAAEKPAPDISGNQDKLQDIISQNVPKQESKSQAAAAPAPVKPAPVPAPSAREDIPMPVMNSVPAAPEVDFAPPPEEPPEEYIPPREFDTAPAAAVVTLASVNTPEAAPAPEVKPEPANTAEGKPAAEEKPENTAAEPAQTTSAGYEKLSVMSREEWDGILAKVSDALYAAMLEDSTASVNADGVLEIHTGNLMLQGMTANGTQELEKVLSQASGRKLRAKVVGDDTDTAAEEENSAVKGLLEKARRLNIDVQIK